MADIQPLWRAHRALVIEEDQPQISYLRLRVPTTEHALAIERTLGVGLPDVPDTVLRAADVESVWLAPGEWALIGPEPAEVVKICRSVVGVAVHHVADMTDAWIRWRLSGDGATKLLAMGCSLDLHAKAFAVGRAARTLLGQVRILLIRDEMTWAVHAEAALKRHVRLWFQAAGSGTTR